MQSRAFKLGLEELLERNAFAIATVILGIIFAIAFGVPKKMIYPAHDFLDNYLVVLKLRSEVPRLFFNLDATVPILDGLTLNALPMNDFGLSPNLYLLFDPFTALAINEVLARGLGFVGLYLLLTRHILPCRPETNLIAVGAAILFSLLPYWDTAGTIMLQPLLLFAVINLCQRRHILASWLIVLFFPFYSYLVFGGFGVVAVLGIAWLYALIYRKPYRNTLLAVTSVLSIIYIAMEFRVIKLLFFSNFVSHRVEWRIFDPSWPEFFRAFANDFVFGVYYMYSGQFPIVLTAIGLVGAVVWRARSSSKIVTLDSIVKQQPERLKSLLMTLVAIALAISILYASETSHVTAFAFWFPIPFQVLRLTALHPMIWQVAFALAVSLLCIYLPRLSRPIAIGFASLALLEGILISHSVVPRLENMAGLSAKAKGKLCIRVPNFPVECHPSTVSDYYRIGAYKELARKIGRRQSEYSVASLDIDPMIAAFNGFHTIDGYVSNYPLSYKHRFEKVIEKELDKFPRLGDFREWGSRVALYHGSPDEQLSSVFCGAYNLGAEYILAPRKISNIEVLKLAAESEGMFAYQVQLDACAKNRS